MGKIVGLTLMMDHPPLTPIHIQMIQHKYLTEHTPAVKNKFLHLDILFPSSISLRHTSLMSSTLLDSNDSTNPKNT